MSAVFKREYYTLAQAAKHLGIPDEDLLHLGATGKTKIFGRLSADNLYYNAVGTDANNLHDNAMGSDADDGLIFDQSQTGWMRLAHNSFCILSSEHIRSLELEGVVRVEICRDIRRDLLSKSLIDVFQWHYKKTEMYFTIGIFETQEYANEYGSVGGDREAPVITTNDLWLLGSETERIAECLLSVNSSRLVMDNRPTDSQLGLSDNDKSGHPTGQTIKQEAADSSPVMPEESESSWIPNARKMAERFKQSNSKLSQQGIADKVHKEMKERHKRESGEWSVAAVRFQMPQP